MKLKGFTLIEILTTLIILAVVALFCTTAVSLLKNKNEQQLIVDELSTAIQYAKIQAISLGGSVSLLPLNKTDWLTGMKLIQYHPKTNQEELLHQWQWHHPLWNIRWSGVSSSKGIVFSNNPISAMSNGKFILLNASTKTQVVIILNKLGRIKVVEDSESHTKMDPGY